MFDGLAKCDTTISDFKAESLARATKVKLQLVDSLQKQSDLSKVSKLESQRLSEDIKNSLSQAPRVLSLGDIFAH
jgi:hypothetical protein